MRGGAWNNNPQNVRVSNRNRNEPTNRNNKSAFVVPGMRSGASVVLRLAGGNRFDPWITRECQLRFRAADPDAGFQLRQTARHPGFLVAP